MQRKYMHMRYHRQRDVTEQNMEGVCNLGGVTLGYDVDEHAGELRWAFVVCNERDNFCRAVGRELVNKAFDEQEYRVMKFVGEWRPQASQRIALLKRRVLEHVARSWYASRLVDWLGRTGGAWAGEEVVVDDYLY